jgi:hypothetical protein
MAKVVVTIEVPERHLQAWLQVLRDFDSQHHGCSLQIMVETELSTKEINEVMDTLEPPMRLRGTIPLKN